MNAIYGFLGSGKWLRAEVVPAAVARMAGSGRPEGSRCVQHWLDDAAGVALARQRPSTPEIQDNGLQPLHSTCGRYVLVFSGEVYNQRELCKTAGLQDSSHVLELLPETSGDPGAVSFLASLAAHGIRRTVECVRGKFAFALWDRAGRTLTLGRDRVGEQSLYYGWQGNGADACFLFSSGLGAIMAHPVFSAEVNRGAVALYVRHDAVPAPHSIFRGIHKLPPGHFLTLRLGQREPHVEQYWSFPEVAEHGVADPWTADGSAAVDHLEALLKEVIAEQMPDGPAGAFLSGGIDSSAVAALMQAQSRAAVKTFAIGFQEDSYNEAAYAKAVAQHLGTDHVELYVTPSQARDVIPSLARIYGEPFADSSQIPTFFVARLAREHVSTVLTGDAGDELFGGYSRYFHTEKMWNRAAAIPRWLRSVAAPALVGMSRLNLGIWGQRAGQVASLLSARSIDEFYLDRMTHWNPEDLVLDATEPTSPLRGAPLPLVGLNPIQRLMALDAVTYLPDDCLVKVERAATSTDLQTCIPFLDPRVIRFAWQLPNNVRISKGIGKWPLREVLYRYVPKALVERPKMGFGVPLDVWLRGPLKDWAESLLDAQRLRQEGFFDPEPVRQRWTEHVTGRRNWQYHLWPLLIFQSWLDDLREHRN